MSTSAIMTLTIILLLGLIAFPALVEAKRVNLAPGDKIDVRLQIDEPTSIHELSFRAKSVEDSDSDPFRSSHSRIPVSAEIIENDKLVGSESATVHTGSSFKKFNIDMNNDPKVTGSFNVVIAFDNPENGDHDAEIRIDIDSIKVIDDKENDLDIVRTSVHN